MRASGRARALEVRRSSRRFEAADDGARGDEGADDTVEDLRTARELRARALTLMKAKNAAVVAAARRRDDPADDDPAEPQGAELADIVAAARAEKQREERAALGAEAAARPSLASPVPASIVRADAPEAPDTPAAHAAPGAPGVPAALAEPATPSSTHSTALKSTPSSRGSSTRLPAARMLRKKVAQLTGQRGYFSKKYAKPAV